MLVGFLKFLKRGKKEGSLDKMDLPPVPPPMEDFDDNIPDFPEFEHAKYASLGKDSQKLDFPDIGHPDKDHEFANIGTGQEKSIQSFPKDFPVFPDIDESQMASIEPIRMPLSALEPKAPSQKTDAPYNQENESKPEQTDSPKHDAYRKAASKSPEQKKKISRQGMDAREIYVRIDKFKATLGGINSIRSDLRKSEETLVKLENIKSSKDKSLDTVKSCMEDLQKKLIFIDKTLFKGE